MDNASIKRTEIIFKAITAKYADIKSQKMLTDDALQLLFVADTEDTFIIHDENKSITEFFSSFEKKLATYHPIYWKKRQNPVEK